MSKMAAVRIKVIAKTVVVVVVIKYRKPRK